MKNYIKKKKNLMTWQTKKVWLESDILECEVKWTLGSITRNKLVEVKEFQLSYLES